MIMINTFIKNNPKQFFGGTALFLLNRCLGGLRQQQATQHYQWIVGRGLCLLPPIKPKI